VGLNLKNFDMAIVFKDFSKEVLRIDAIPSRKLEAVKDWLTSVNIKYYESRLNLAWKPILRSIQVRRRRWGCVCVYGAEECSAAPFSFDAAGRHFSIAPRHTSCSHKNKQTQPHPPNPTP